MITTELASLVLKNSTMVLGLSAQLIQMLLRLWSPFRDWYDEDLVISHAARSATSVETAQRQIRQRERVYKQFVYKEMGIPVPANTEIDQKLEDFSIRVKGGVDIYPRVGTSPLDVWMRPAEQYRYQISTGLRENDALLKALERVEQMADTDLTLARREETRAIYEATPSLKGFRRVIHPELAKDGMSCGLCVVASTRVYKRGELLPIHDGCNCDTLPITSDADPGLTINQDDLQRLYDAAGSTYAGDLLKTKVSFLEHGELGPIIANTSAKGYEGARKKNGREFKDSDLSPLENFEHQLKILRDSSQRLIERKQAGESGLDMAIAWQRDRVSVLTRQVQAMRGLVSA